MANNRLKTLDALNKDFYTSSDLQKIFRLPRKSMLVTVSRMQKRGEIARIAKGYYQLADKPIRIERIATQLYQPSYISFESALSRFGAISQVPYRLTLVTINKPKKIVLSGQAVEYRRVKQDLLFGFELIDGAYVATAEKALLDTLYMRSKGKLQIDLDDINKKVFDNKRLLLWAKNYPSAVLRLVKSIYQKQTD